MFGKTFGKAKLPSFGKQNSMSEASYDSKQVWVHGLDTMVTIPAENLTPLPANTYPNFRPFWLASIGKVVPFKIEDYPREYRMHKWDDGRNASTNRTFPSLPDFFEAVAVPCLSKKYVDVMKKFNLGESLFFPITVFKADGTTPHIGEHFGMYFGETKAAVSYPECSGLKIRNTVAGPLIAIRIELENGQFAVRGNALDDLDMWIDPQCNGVFFISGRLKKALDDVVLTPDFHFKSCRMI